LSEAEKRHHLGHWRFCVVSRDLPRGRSGSVFAQPRASLAVRARRNRRAVFRPQRCRCFVVPCGSPVPARHTARQSVRLAATG